MPGPDKRTREAATQNAHNDHAAADVCQLETVAGLVDLANRDLPADPRFATTADHRLSPAWRDLTALCRRYVGPGLRVLVLFGSRLSQHIDPNDEAIGLPDLLAILDDGTLDVLLQRHGNPWLLRWAARHLQPTTLALRSGATVVAKLNLIERGALLRDLRRLPDLYLAGRISKVLRPLYSREAHDLRDLQDAAHLAAQRIADWVLRDIQDRVSIDDAVARCVALSYRAELRPEGPRKLQAMHAQHGDFFRARFAPPLQEQAACWTIRFDADHGLLCDARGPIARLRDRWALHALLGRSRLRSIARWPKQMLAYDGWWPYVKDKLRRAHQQESTP